ncbi:MAG TPA: hypothetical protein VHM00_03120 [Caldimonas sp.]|jgi:hypothetical protein|nr:hypothetical protein [Caldimonas sp.]HEX2540055.1 hypothetical protein [Caldimonas sp.]
MAERRRVSLLDFAIASSLVVVPVMLGVLLLVAVVRPSTMADAGWRTPADRYVSVRHVAALKTFEQAIVAAPPAAPPVTAAQVLDGVPRCRREWADAGPLQRWLRAAGVADPARPAPAERIAARLADLDAALLRFSGRANARVEHRVGLDLGRWFAAADAAIDEPVESSDYPDRQFKVRCADLVGALAALGRADGRMLETLAWRGSEGAASLARWRPDQQMAVAPTQVTRRNPWGGLAGCIYLGRQGEGEDTAPRHFIAGARSLQNRVCAMPSLAGAATSDRSEGAAAGPSPLAGEPGTGDATDDSRWRVPPSLHALLQPLQPLRQPSGALYRLLTEPDAEPLPARGSAGLRVAAASPLAGLWPAAAPPRSANRIVVDGAPIEVGFSVDLTIDPSLQAVAQKTAACYTGRHDVCRAMGLRRAEDADRPLGSQLLEGAMVRMAAVAVIDVASGRIEALAGALSPCAREEVDGPGRGADCDPRLPYPVQYRPDALLNPAVFHAAMPASTIKPIMAAAFLSEPGPGTSLLLAERKAMQRGGLPARDSLRGQLMRSDSARFLDRMFCLDKGFAACQRPWDLQATAAAFGWNAGCDDAERECGAQGLLFGDSPDAQGGAGRRPPLERSVLYGRLMSEPLGRKLGAPMRLMPSEALDVQRLRRCAAGADGRRLSDDDWEKCRGGHLVDVVAEGWGQGHARASTLGIAGMMATLAAAANGQAEVRRPHLVASLRGVAGHGPAQAHPVLARWSTAEAQPLRVSQDAAEVILSGLSYSHRAGTARTACEQVFDARRCRDIGWLAGKTGTPSFPSDGVPLDELARLCRGGAGVAKEAAKGAAKGVAKGATTATAKERQAACSSLRPYKWYVATYRTDGSAAGPWTKAIAVLAERNWLRRNGQVHGSGDHGPNPAAEIALQIAGRHTGAIAGAAP